MIQKNLWFQKSQYILFDNFYETLVEATVI